jgi:hypothetical protein
MISPPKIIVGSFRVVVEEEDTIQHTQGEMLYEEAYFKYKVYVKQQARNRNDFH